MKPKKHLIARAEANGSMARLNQLLSASHILLCEANALLEEAADLMRDNGLLLGEIKQLHNRFTTAADRYLAEFASMVDTEQKKMDMFSDMDGFDEYFRRWSKLPKDWKPRDISPNSTTHKTNKTCHLLQPLSCVNYSTSKT